MKCSKHDYRVAYIRVRSKNKNYRLLKIGKFCINKDCKTFKGVN